METKSWLSPAVIAEAFSTGNYARACPYLAEDAVWEIFDRETLVGRTAVEANCRQAVDGYTLVGTDLCIDEVDEDGQMVLVTGTVDYLREGECARSVATCDIYTFCPAGRLLSISSYCTES